MKIAALVLLLVTVTVHARTDDELVGLYDCIGVNPDGSTYTGTTELTRGADGVYALHWMFPPSAEGFGLGMLKGDTLSVIFQTETGAVGLAVFTVDRRKGLQLIGPWLSPGALRLGSETLTRRGLVPA